LTSNGKRENFSSNINTQRAYGKEEIMKARVEQLETIENAGVHRK
jgi:hypothetical protein